MVQCSKQISATLTHIKLNYLDNKAFIDNAIYIDNVSNIEKNEFNYKPSKPINTGYNASWQDRAAQSRRAKFS